MRSWRGLYRIASTFLRAIPQMANLVLLVVLAVLIFALLGMQLFGGALGGALGGASEAIASSAEDVLIPPEFPPPPRPALTRYHFDYCGPAMLTIFIVLTGEWVDAMNAAVGALGVHASLFYIVAVLVGKYLLLNQLIAVVLTEFTAGNGIEDDDEADDEKGGGRSDGAAHGSKPVKASRYGPRGGVADVASAAASLRAVNAEPEWPHDHALWLFARTHPLRRFCTAVGCAPAFELLITLAILASSVCLALDVPRLDRASDLARCLARFDVYFTLLFCAAMLVKIVSLGFVSGEGAYLASAWNRLDFAIVASSLVVLVTDAVAATLVYGSSSSPQLQALRYLKILRVLRPLRIISRNAGMKLILTSLFKAMPAVSNVFGVVLALQLVFTILGLQLYMGLMASCELQGLSGSTHQGHGELEAVVPPSSREECDEAGGKWRNMAIGSFDDFGSAMRLLYVMSSGDGWQVSMFRLMDATAKGHAPVRNDFDVSGALFSISWMLVVSTKLPFASRQPCVQQEKNRRPVALRPSLGWPCYAVD